MMYDTEVSADLSSHVPVGRSESYPATESSDNFQVEKLLSPKVNIWKHILYIYFRVTFCSPIIKCSSKYTD